MESSELPDEELLLRFARRKDHDAFHQLVSRYSRVVFGVCHRILLNHHDTEDAFQATFLILARDAEKVRCPSVVSGWLYGTAYRVALAALARKRRLHTFQLDEAVPESESVLSEITRRRDREIIDEELCGLPCSYRDIVVLRYLDGKSTKEVAMQLKMTTGAVKGRLERAKHILRRRLLLRGVYVDRVGRAVSGQQIPAAAIAPTLVEDTAIAACRFRSGKGIDGPISANVLSLVTHGQTSMLSSTSLKVGVGVVSLATLMLVLFSQLSRQSSAQETIVHLDEAIAVEKRHSADSIQFRSVAVSDKQDDDLSVRERELGSTKNRIIEGIKANYAGLSSVVATIETRTIDPSVIRRTKETFEKDDGTVITFVRSPLHVLTNNVTLRGHELRSDPVDDGGTVWTHVDGLWTQYIVNSDTAYVRRTSQMPGMFPIDPRDVGSTEIRETLLEQLNGSKLKSIREVEDNLQLLWERSEGRRAGMQYRSQVDPKRNYLPIKFEYLNKEGKPYLTMDISYQKVSDGVWFLREAQTLFRSGTVMKVRTLAKPRVNEPISNEVFRIDFSPGTEIRDSAHSSIYRVGLEPPPDTDARTEVGDPVPAFTVTTLDGQRYNSKELLGQAYMISFFATWCGPCLAKLQQIEGDLLKRAENADLLVLAIGCGHSVAELRDFVKEQEISVAVAADAERAIYERFARKKIPRTYVIDADGTIVHQSLGYNYPKYKEIVRAVEKATEE